MNEKIVIRKTGKQLLEQMDATVVPQDGIGIWQLGQESLVVKQSGLIIYFDPYLSASPARSFAPPILPEEIYNADYVIITHHHSDHLDPFTLKDLAIRSPQAVFICPAPHIERMVDAGIARDRIIPAQAGIKFELASGIAVTPVACKHEQYITDAEGNHFFLGYVIDFNGLVFYHAGDALADQELEDALKPHQIEIACMPINGHDWRRLRNHIYGNMTFREAADMAAEIGAEMIIPMHYDMFAGNTENPAYFVDYLLRYYPMLKFKMLAPGERMLYLTER
ncbi:MBL fold metallo-hydrolase [Paenibacillus periandrae]|uniref:MBL fold metallo-hydrolase n=1 Tax=Paenibacillus periandrae TaxID=1761741 RepID=UPI001F09AFFB|nr:MBL fold metallo-hydrolase [Paenibacillus periandrae]